MDRGFRGLCLGMALLIAVISCGSASIQDQIDLSNASPIYISPGVYSENVIIHRPVTLVGIGNPTVTALDPGESTMSVTSPDVVVTGFTVLGAKSASGFDVSNASPKIFYNNIYGNGIGLSADNASPMGDNASPVDARYCFWGNGGDGPQKGAPGVGGNNPVIGDVIYTPWVTAPVANGLVVFSGSWPVRLDNPGAGVRLEVFDGVNNNAIGGSALYLSAPYNSNLLPAIAVKYVDAFVSGNIGGKAIITMTYSDIDLVYVTEDSLKLYLWDGTRWIEATNICRDTTANTISGEFPASLLGRSPIALAGQSYSVTILPAQNPAVPITTKPVFSTFRIESVTDLVNIYYQVDGYSSAGWKLIQSNVNAKTWNWPGWSLPDEDWDSLPQGTHTIYFRFTRAGGANPVGDLGEISWQFFKSTKVSYVKVIQPNGGETLTRQPYTIMWTLPYTDGVDTITLRYSRDSGLTYPYLIARIQGAATRWIWRSPNVGTTRARILVTVRYADGSEYSGTSEGDFTIAKGYSFMSWAPEFGYTSFRAWAKPPFSFHIG